MALPLNVGFLLFLFVASNLVGGYLLDLLLLFSATAYFVLLCRREPRPLRRALMTAYGLRLFAALVSYTDIYPLEGAKADALFFTEVGQYYAQYDLVEMISRYNEVSGGIYGLIAGIVFRVFTDAPLIMILFNVILSALTVRYAFLLANRLFDARLAAVAAWATAFTPYLIILGATMLREAALIFLLTYSVYRLVCFRQSRSVHDLFAAMLAISASVPLHGAMAPAMIAVLLIGLFTINPLRTPLTAFVSVLLVSVVTYLGAQLVTGGITLYKLEFLAKSSEAGVTSEILRHAGGAFSEGNYREEVVLGSPLDVVWAIPKVVLPFLFQPYPWRIWELKTYILLFLGSGVWTLLGLLWLRNVRLVVTNRDAVVVLLIAATVLVVFAFGSSNLNQAIRHNHKVMPLMLVVMAPYLYRLYRQVFGRLK